MPDGSRAQLALQLQAPVAAGGPAVVRPAVRCDACLRPRAADRCPRHAQRRSCRTDETTRFLGELVPRVPLRHWRLVPDAADTMAGLGREVLATWARCFVHAIFTAQRASVRAAGLSGLPATGGVRCGAVSVVQRLTSQLQPGVCVDVLALDGVYVRAGRGPPVFHPALEPPPVEEVAARLQSAIIGAGRTGSLGIAVEERSAPGPRLGGGFRRVRPRGGPGAAGPGVASGGRGHAARTGAGRVLAGIRLGASLDAARRRRAAIRGIVAPRLDPAAACWQPNGWLRYALPWPLADGTRYVELSAQSLAARLVALVGAPARRVEFHGVLRSGRRARGSIVPAQLTLDGRGETPLPPPPPGRVAPHRVRAAQGARDSSSRTEGAK